MKENNELNYLALLWLSYKKHFILLPKSLSESWRWPKHKDLGLVALEC